MHDGVCEALDSGFVLMASSTLLVLSQSLIKPQSVKVSSNSLAGNSPLIEEQSAFECFAFSVLMGGALP
ncbi:hypothetical protein NQZ68_034587 [Dissostichus eleginoides]|nr:hypothetical protein NQZ68_034587 [Dissostichus eleginoides]